MSRNPPHAKDNCACGAVKKKSSKTCTTCKDARRRDATTARYWSSFEQDAGGGWTGSRDKHGYGRVQRDGHRLAHRWGHSMDGRRSNGDPYCIPCARARAARAYERFKEAA